MSEENKVGDLKVWWIAQAPGKPIEIPVPNVEAGAVLMNALAEYDAYQLICNIKPDYCNAGGLIEWDGVEWTDWEHPETYDQDPQDTFPQPSLGWCSKLSELT